MSHRVLITGANGLLGNRIVARLNDEHIQIIKAVYATDVPDNTDDKILFADLSNTSSIDILKKANPQIVIHCAAHIPQNTSMEESNKSAEINAKIDSNVIQYCVAADAKLIYLSGTSVYGLKTNLRCDEESPYAKDLPPYIHQKVETEKKIIEKVNQYVVLRVSAPYAPGQKARTVLKIFIEAALQNKNLLYYGNGDRRQDFTHADDIAEAVYLSLNKEGRHIFNIASGRSIAMKELAGMIKEMLPDCESEILASGIEDPQENFRADFNIDSAKKILGWSAKKKLEDGIREWIDFLEKNKGK